MKKQFLVSLILISLVITINAQWSTTNPPYTMSNVGIGITSPNNAKLHIQGNGTYDAVIRLVNSSTNGGDWSLITANDSWTAGFGSLLFASGGPSSDNAKFTITKLGNVGIGTTLPNNAKLQIQGAGTYDAVIRLVNSSTNGSDWSLIAANDTWSAGSGSLLFAPGGPSSDNAKFTITKLGNIGIGTTLPNNAKLQIQGAGTYDAVIRLVNSSTNGSDWSLIATNDTWTAGSGNLLFTSGGSSSENTKLVITKSGNVGIGTTLPNNAKLQIQGAGTYDAVIRLVNSSTNGSDWSLIATNDTWTAGSGNLLFTSGGSSSENTKLVITKSGNVGIGTTNPDTRFKLDVEGTIRASEIKVCLKGGCDFVFKRDYKLMDLKELETFVRSNQHLPEIASEKEMVDNGVNMKELQMKLLQKMEEMTLYMIAQNKEIESLKQEITELKKK